MQADTIKFYNVGGEGSGAGGGQSGAFGFSAMASGMIKKVELQQESCAHMSAFCGPAHFSIVIASVTGSMQVWSPRPSKFIQPLAPNFTEIEDNILYVEKEDEFENEVSSEEDTPEEQIGDGAFGKSLIQDLSMKQKKLARVDLDIDTIDPLHLSSPEQRLADERPDLISNLDNLFIEDGSEPMQIDEFQPQIKTAHIDIKVSCDDMFAVLARNNLDFFKEKFDKLL